MADARRQVRPDVAVSRPCRFTTTRTPSTSCSSRSTGPRPATRPTWRTSRRLREAWERFAADDQAWVAIITGVGEAFFAGADLKTYVPEITKFQKEIAEKGLTEIDGYRLDDGTRSVLRNWPLYKPVIAAVNGFCTAGGMEMLGGCDIRVACPEAKFAVMEPKRGLFAGGGTTVRLPRQIPWPQAMEFLLCADLIPAERAYEMGLLNAIVPRDQLLDKAREYAARMIANAPLAVQATKESALKGLYVDEDAITQVRERGSRAARRARADRRRRPGDRAGAIAAERRGARRSSARSCAPRSRRRAGSRARSSRPRTPRRARRRSPRSASRCGRRSDARSTRARRASSGSRRTRGTPRSSATTGAPEPLEMWEHVARGSPSATPARPGLLGALDSVQIVFCQTWEYDDPVARLAGRLGADPRHRHYSGIGGTTTQQLVNSTSEAMLRGEMDLALITSAEALATKRLRKRQGERYAASFAAGRALAVPVGVAARPDRGGPRGVPGLADVRGVRQRPAGASRPRPRRVPRRASASCSRR